MFTIFVHLLSLVVAGSRVGFLKGDIFPVRVDVNEKTFTFDVSSRFELDGELGQKRLDKVPTLNNTNSGLVVSAYFPPKQNYVSPPDVQIETSETIKECIVIVEGRVGLNAAINGAYEPNSMTNGRLDYLNPLTGVFLYWQTALGGWLIGSQLGSDVMNAGNFGDVPTPELLTTTWQVYDGVAFILDPNVQTRCDIGACMVGLEGRIGVNDLINGFYDPFGVQDGRPAYVHIENGGFLYWHAELLAWLIGEELGSDVIAAANFQDQATPELIIQTWQIFDGVSFVLDPNIETGCLTADCFAALSGREGPNSLINGVYVSNTVTDARPDFFNRLSGFYLYWNTESQAWFIGRQLGSTNVAAVNSENALTPDLITAVWQVFDGEIFVPDLNVQIRCDTIHDYEWIVQQNIGSDCYDRCTEIGKFCVHQAAIPYTEDDMMLLGISGCDAYGGGGRDRTPFMFLNIRVSCTYGYPPYRRNCAAVSEIGGGGWNRVICPCL